jgi:hypothetical protein
MSDVNLSEKAKNLKTGKYMHYKGDIAAVSGVALHSETQEEFVVYTHKNKDGVLLTWVRPLDMFLETVVVDGEEKPRFRFIEE